MIILIFFVKLKSKMYTFIREDNHESKNAKDINKNVVYDQLNYEVYQNALFKRIMYQTRNEHNSKQKPFCSIVKNY